MSEKRRCWRIHKRQHASDRKVANYLFDKPYGKADFVTEVEAKEIRETNKAQQTAYKKRCLMVHRKIEDFQTARDLGITVPELNRKRMIG